ncbi:major facilitator family transporter [Legionella hackeliae]|uniref:Major facilitator superfamily, general substrate transporter n=2 Tax=Legionella hackeliae TaxID=449 RepID=A0A0A8UP17_LEGHA|nr:major facilitator family transporter [Legionella hackeliae]CEK09256.1 Major facilitator superfamily, general substrate transporter [Legionella hackeliae]STX49164.1 major facilitator family transporter [Legionella hackeliae]
MAPIIGAKFFPQASDGNATIEALMVFAAGFLFRPLGGIFFGYFGDTRGRAKTLRISILTITLSTFLLGVIPSYEEIGLTAPIVFILLRLIQGVSIGGEYSGIIIYLAESAPLNKRGFITSFAAMGANLGFLLATVTLLFLHLFFSEETITNWAWRLPFLLIGLPGSLIIYYRFKLSETPVYSQLQKKHRLVSIPFITAIKFAPHQLLKILGLTCMGSTFYYVFFAYIPNYLEHYIGFSLSNALTIESLMLIIMLFTVPLAGLCGDFFTRKKMLIITSVAIIFLVLPCFYLLQFKSVITTLISLGTATILSSLEQGNTLAAIVENCPENIRYSGIAFSYNLGNALFGGSTPLVVTLLTEKMGLITPAYYLIFMAAMTLIAATTLLSNNQFLGPIRNSTRSRMQMNS